MSELESERETESHHSGAQLWKGALHFRSSLWCSANHNALGQLANQSGLCLSEGGTLCLREAGHRGPTIMCFLNIKACQHILLHQIMIFKKASYDPFKPMNAALLETMSFKMSFKIHK